jgi:hypothetical protein
VGHLPDRADDQRRQREEGDADLDAVPGCLVVSGTEHGDGAIHTHLAMGVL